MAPKLIPEPICLVLPDSDLEHSAEQLWIVGDNPADMDDQLLLQNSLPLPTRRAAFVIDDALNLAWWQWVGDHLFFMSKHTERHLTHTGESTQSWTTNNWNFIVSNILNMSVFLWVFARSHVLHSTSSMVQFLQFLCSITLKLASFQWVDDRSQDYSFVLVSAESHLMKITPQQSSSW